MKKEKKEINRELIKETTLALIEENGGIKNVNLRGIAREIGCAHTNLYNYFDSFNEIIWESLSQVLLKLMAYVESSVDSKAEDDEKMLMIFSSIIDFSMNHPAWYRLIWLEEVDGEPSNEVKQILFKPGKELSDALIKVSGNKLTEEKAVVIVAILHNYLHGELCNWINNRSFTNSSKEMKAKILSNLKLLYGLLMNEAT
ncbi:TetR/AcrR family transcriptional regulator [Natronospora cellulosivora (SeqCode)]